MEWDTWYSWNTFSVTNVTSSSNSTWQGWTSAGTASYYNTNSSSSATWNTWNTRYTPQAQWQPSEPTPEMRMRQERGANRLKLERHFKRIAKLRARRLLLSVLSPRQREEFRSDNSFIVHGSEGGIYELQLGRYHNIFRCDDEGNLIEELCGCVEEAVPDEDNLVAQKLWLETNESYFRSLCNIWEIGQNRFSGRRMIQRAQREGRQGGADAAYTRGEVLV